jgi:hypothetical protein
MALIVLYGLDVGTENVFLNFIEQIYIFHSLGEDLGEAPWGNRHPKVVGEFGRTACGLAPQSGTRDSRLGSLRYKNPPTTSGCTGLFGG